MMTLSQIESQKSYEAMHEMRNITMGGMFAQWNHQRPSTKQRVRGSIPGRNLTAKLKPASMCGQTPPLLFPDTALLVQLKTRHPSDRM